MSSVEHHETVDDVIAWFLIAQEQGEQAAELRESLLRQYPLYRSQLLAFLDDDEQMAEKMRALTDFDDPTPPATRGG